MNTSLLIDEVQEKIKEGPGAYLATVRLQKGYSSEYVAGKLHLRVRLIELLEADAYESMPEPVFIKGYLRAYAKLLDVAPEPLLEIYNGYSFPERKIERALWQSRKETHKAEHAVRWITAFFAIGVIIAVAVWWQTNKENEKILPTTMSRSEAEPAKSENEIRLTDLSKMRSLLSSSNQFTTEENQYSKMEKEGE